MNIWTILPELTWQKLKSKKRLFCESSYVDDFYLPSYRWMASRMSKRLNMACSPDLLPHWGWYQRGDWRKRRPDLRQSGYLPKGTAGVRLELEKSAGEILLSDFELWHYVLNYWYLPESADDLREFQERLEHRGLSCKSNGRTGDKEIDAKIIKSWEKIFDLGWCATGISSPRPQKAIQATFFDLRLDEVKQVTEFRAR